MKKFTFTKKDDRLYFSDVEINEETLIAYRIIDELPKGYLCVHGSALVPRIGLPLSMTSYVPKDEVMILATQKGTK